MKATFRDTLGFSWAEYRIKFEILIGLIINTIFDFSLTECECLSKPKCKGFINDNCRDNPCQNGQCIDLENDYKCECQSGYKGQ